MRSLANWCFRIHVAAASNSSLVLPARGDNMRTRFPDIEFVKPCNLCPHMKRITLPKIFDCLRELRHPVEIDASTSLRARAALERMLAVGRRDRV